MNKILKLLLIINFYLIFHPLSANTDSISIKGAKFWILTSINYPLNSSISYSVLDGVNNNSVYKMNLQRYPLYSLNVGYKIAKRVFIEGGISYSYTEFKGKSFHESMYGSTSFLYNYQAYQKVNYQFVFFDLGFGYLQPIGKRHSVEVSAKWLLTVSRTATVYNYLDESYPQNYLGYYHLVPSAKINLRNSSSNALNYGLHLGYNYSIKKWIGISIGVNYFNFNYEVKSEGSYIGSALPPYSLDARLAYSIQNYRNLSVSVGLKAVF